MRLERKKEVAESIAERLAAAQTIYLTDFTGLDVQAMTALRDLLQENGVHYLVVKNTLVRRALEGLDLPELDEHLVGPTGLVLADEDPVIPARAVRDFAKEHDGRPVLKIGVVDRRTVEPETVARLADLPPREQLLGSIAGSLTAGVAGIAGALAALVRDIALMAEEVARRGEQETA